MSHTKLNVMQESLKEVLVYTKCAKPRQKTKKIFVLEISQVLGNYKTVCYSK
jgi:hypothetical protein